MEEKQDYVIRIFNEAKRRGICHNQKEFAESLGFNPSTVSSAINGQEKALTDRLVKRVKLWAKEHLEQEQPKKDDRPDIVIPAATMDLYTSMAKSIDRLTSLVERLQPGASSYSGAYSPKNFLADRK